MRKWELFDRDRTDRPPRTSELVTTVAAKVKTRLRLNIEQLKGRVKFLGVAVAGLGPVVKRAIEEERSYAKDVAQYVDYGYDYYHRAVFETVMITEED